MKTSITVLLFATSVLLLSSVKVNAQEKTIVNLLNSQLQKELKLYPNEDSLVILQPFKINEKKELVVKFKRTNVHLGETEIVTQMVSLSKIKGLVKDINVLFETEADAVTIFTATTTKEGPVVPETKVSSDLFFTQINKEQGNEDFRDKIITAFKKAGYKIDCTIWAD